eukprot:m.42405 g.42405  ORF g.42405 m.42405 type:complete len:631 (+) comp9879_c0_seq1:277-2169(+)
MPFFKRLSKGKLKTSDGTIRRQLSKKNLARHDGRPSSVFDEQDLVHWESTVPDKVLKNLDNKEKKRQQVIFELMQTENAYIRDLLVIKQLFRQSLIDKNVLDANQIYGLFSNIDEIFSVNSELYETLLSRRKDGVVENVADVFLDMFSGQRFDAYESFCANQLPASELYSLLCEKNTEFDQVMKECVANTQESRGFDLPAFLLKGMQRLLKYHPLLLQIMRNTKETNHVQIGQLTDAMQMIEEHGRRVNEKVRASENARRLYKINESLIRDGPKRNKKEPELDLLRDSSRHLVFEGRMKLIRSQAVANMGKTMEVYLILLSDMLLITTERDDKYVLRASKEIPPVIPIESITHHKTDTTGTGIDRVRNALLIETSEPIEKGKTKEKEKEKEKSKDKDKEIDEKFELDTPKPWKNGHRKEYYKFIVPSQGALRHWVMFLHEARQNQRDRRYRRERQKAVKGDQGQEFAVTLLVTTQIEFKRNESSTDHDEPEDVRVSDWEITFDAECTSDEEGTIMETTRHVRLVKEEDGLGFTIIGKAPVIFQEVEEGGPAYKAGIREGDQVRAINGQECTNMEHSEVVGLIRQALSVAQPRAWAPVLNPLQPFKEMDLDSMASSERGSRSLRVAMLEER